MKLTSYKLYFADANRACVWAVPRAATQVQEDEDCNKEAMVLVAERREEEIVVKVGI